MIKTLLKSIHGPIYQKRLECLADLILPNLSPGDSVLDVGCGGGALGALLLSHQGTPQGLVVEGLENHPRGGEPIRVHKYEGGTFPFTDGAFDVVCLMDVLHHDHDIASVLREATRVAKRLVIVKDHKPEGFLGQLRICLLDWAANFGYGVKCLYYYPTHKEWKKLLKESDLSIEREIVSMHPYPGLWNFIFGGALHYMVFAKPSK